MGVDPTPARPRRPHAGTLDVDDGKSCRAWHSAGLQWGRGVDITGFAPSARDDALRRRWSPGGRPIVGFVGRLAPEKHVERLAVLARRDDLQLVIVGDGIDRHKLESALSSAVFTGALYGDELAAAYASMDVFVHPGEHETFCQAVQEAMASGLPVVAPDAGGPRDLVAPYRTGLLLPVEEFEDQADRAVDHLIAERQPLLAGGATQCAGPHLAGDLRPASGPLRGPPSPASARVCTPTRRMTTSLAHARGERRPLSLSLARPRPAATLPMS